MRLTRVDLTLTNAYVEIWARMGLRIDSDDLRWSYRAEKKQYRGVMTTARGADLKRATAIKPNHDVLSIPTYSQETGHHLPETFKLQGINGSEESHDLKPLAAMACKAAKRQRARNRGFRV